MSRYEYESDESPGERFARWRRLNPGWYDRQRKPLVGTEAAASYITEAWKVPLTAAELDELLRAGAGPRAESCPDGTPVFEPHDLDHWVIGKYAATPRNFYKFLFKWQDGGFVPDFDPESKRLFVRHIDELDDEEGHGEEQPE